MRCAHSPLRFTRSGSSFSMTARDAGSSSKISQRRIAGRAWTRRSRQRRLPVAPRTAHSPNRKLCFEEVSQMVSLRGNRRAGKTGHPTCRARRATPCPSWPERRALRDVRTDCASDRGHADCRTAAMALDRARVGVARCSVRRETPRSHNGALPRSGQANRGTQSAPPRTRSSPSPERRPGSECRSTPRKRRHDIGRIHGSPRLASFRPYRRG